jgi:hypothetical protein
VFLPHFLSLTKSQTRKKDVQKYRSTHPIQFSLWGNLAVSVKSAATFGAKQILVPDLNQTSQPRENMFFDFEPCNIISKKHIQVCVKPYANVVLFLFVKTSIPMGFG